MPSKIPAWGTDSRYIETDEYYASVSRLGDGRWYALVSPFDGTGCVSIGYFPTDVEAMAAVEDYLPAVVGAA